MKKTRIHLQWSRDHLPQHLGRGVSLHSHTLHSKESLDFIEGAARNCAVLRFLLRRGDARHQRIYGSGLDLRRGWWTPPLAPAEAYRLEAGQIEGLGLEAMVSLTDHDDIEAPMSLQAVETGVDVPISVEWTVPWQGTFFHLGVHNLPARPARGVMRELAAFTSQPNPRELPPLFHWLNEMPGTLLIVNHPKWDEKGVGRVAHDAACRELLEAGRGCLHAIELNGLRPPSENEAARQLAEAWGLPAISGGDRHGIEPDANINLTAAGTFSEFADEVRQGYSEVLTMSHYRVAHARRLLRNMVDILQPVEGHELGWREWRDRVFYESVTGEVRSMRGWWTEGTPLPVSAFETAVRFVNATRAWRGAFPALRAGNQTASL